MNKALRRLFSLASAILRGASLLILLAWTIGRLFTDTFYLTQLLSWIPTVGVVCVVASMLAASWALTVLARGSQAQPDVLHKGRLPRLRWIAAAWWLGVTLWGMAYEHRFFVSPPAIDMSPSDLRIAFWNLGGIPSDGWLDNAHALKSDILIVVGGGGWKPINEFQNWTSPEQVSNLRSDIFNVSARIPVLEYASTILGVSQGAGLDPRAADGVRESRDPGRAMYMLVDVQGTPMANLGRPLVVWVIDLPSDLSLHRADVTEEAASAVRAWKGYTMVRREDGTYGKGEPRAGFPAPDIIMGDFNIPASSASLRTLVGGMTDAYRAAGAGYAATWPADTPIWRLDQAFVGSELRANAFHTRTMGTGSHALIWLDASPLRASAPMGQ